MGKKMPKKDGQKRHNNLVEEGNAVEMESNVLDVLTGNMNDAPESSNRDDDKNKKKEDNNEMKKDRIKKRKSDLNTNEKEFQKARKKHKKSNDLVGGVKGISMETCLGGKDDTGLESNGAMNLESKFDSEKIRVRKDKHKNKNRDGIGAAGTVTETLEHSKMQEPVEVQKICSSEEINMVVKGKEGEYEKPNKKKKKQKLEKVNGNVAGHIAVMSGIITDGNGTDKEYSAGKELKCRELGGAVGDAEDGHVRLKNKSKSVKSDSEEMVPKKKKKKQKLEKVNGNVAGHIAVMSGKTDENGTDKEDSAGKEVECRELGGAVGEADNGHGGKKNKSKSVNSDSEEMVPKKKKKKKQKLEKVNGNIAGHIAVMSGITDGNGTDKEDLAGKEVECRETGGVVGDAVDGHRGKKNKSKSVKSDSKGKHHEGDAGSRKSVNITNRSENAMRNKKVSFSDHVDVFPSDDVIGDASKDGKEGLVYARRYTKEEDEIIMNSVADYIESHNLGDEGLHMVLNCRQSQLKNVWKDIQAAIPWRPLQSVYRRAHVLFERDEKHPWTSEEYEFVQKFVEEHGPKWKMLGEALGKHRHHVKDTWRRIKLANRKKGNWSQEEYQNLFDLVNLDLSMKAFEERKSKHGMLRDNISWTAISDNMQSRPFANCCIKWYGSLASPMVVQGIWADADDYRMLNALSSLDACCMEDVDWDNLVENRSGDVCRKRWDQMIRHLGPNRNKPFGDQVEILANRYRPDMLEARETYDGKCPVDLP